MGVEKQTNKERTIIPTFNYRIFNNAGIMVSIARVLIDNTYVY